MIFRATIKKYNTVFQIFSPPGLDLVWSYWIDKGEKELQFQADTKGQLISELLFDVLNFPKKTTERIDKFLPKNLKSGQITR